MINRIRHEKMLSAHASYQFDVPGCCFLFFFSRETTRKERRVSSAAVKITVLTVINWRSFIFHGRFYHSDFILYHELFLVVSTDIFYVILNIVLLSSPIVTSFVYHVTKYPFQSLHTRAPLSLCGSRVWKSPVTHGCTWPAAARESSLFMRS